MKIAKVKVRGDKDFVLVPITSPEKPSITKDIAKEWQTLVDLIAKVLEVPSGLIMKLEESSIEVFLKSRQKENPYHVALDFLKQGLDVVLVHPTRVYGPGLINESNSATKLIRLYTKGRWPIIPGSGKSIGNYVYICVHR